MKKSILLSAVAAAMVISGGSVSAATISNISGQSCGDSTGTWHFINNQTGGAAAGSLTATWSSGDSCTVTASKVLASTQHFFCTASGALTSASTNLPGRLVLSDFSCDTKEEPPKCDPKVEICKK